MGNGKGGGLRRDQELERPVRGSRKAGRAGLNKGAAGGGRWGRAEAADGHVGEDDTQESWGSEKGRGACRGQKGLREGLGIQGGAQEGRRGDLESRQNGERPGGPGRSW